MMAVFYDTAKMKVKTTHLGAKGYEDYTGHQDLQRKMNYLERHKSTENWNDYTSAGSLAFHMLWNKPTIKASLDDYMRKFNLKKY